eukprot:4677561-Amphidinium_carterae.1
MCARACIKEPRTVLEHFAQQQSDAPYCSLILSADQPPPDVSQSATTVLQREGTPLRFHLEIAHRVFKRLPQLHTWLTPEPTQQAQLHLLQLFACAFQRVFGEAFETTGCFT